MLGIDATAARRTWTAALVVVLLYLVYMVRATLFVFVLAVLFAYLLAPLVNFLDRFLPGRTRTPALALSYIIFVGGVIVGGEQIGSRVVEQAGKLAKDLPARIEAWKKAAPPASPGIIDKYKTQLIDTAQKEISKRSSDVFAALAEAGLQALTVASGVIYAVVIPILGFFFLKDGRAIRDQILDALPDNPRRVLLTGVFGDLNALLAHYMRALLVLSAATFAVYAIFFSILGIPYGILLAAIAAMLEIIPMLGPITAGAMIVLVAFVSGTHALATLIFLVAYRLFQDYVLSPHVMGKGVELHPLLIMFGVYAGAEIGGIAGMFLSVPMLALVRILFLRMRKARAAAAAEASH